MSAVGAAAASTGAHVAPNRRLLVIALLALLAIATTVGTLGVGAVRVPFPGSVWALFGHGTPDEINIVRNYELPRILLAWLVGGGLAISGTVIQGVIRNPLAAPDIIGITKGAGLAAVTALLLFPSTSVYQLPVASFIGGLLAFTLVYVVAYRGGASPVRLALVGIAVSTVCEAIIRLLLVKNVEGIAEALTWLTGSLAGRNMTEVYQILPWMVVLIPLTFFVARRLDVLGLGDDMAAGLGERVEHFRRLTLLLAVMLASAAVAVGGTIAFLGLIAPHMARRLVGARHALLIPASGFLGAFLLLVSDAIGRGIHPPLELPAGLITALIGGPYFLYLLSKSL